MEIIAQTVSAGHSTNHTKFYRATNERTAGFMPSYDAPKYKISNDFEGVMNEYRASPQAEEIPKPNSSDDKFGFFDMLDMVNPLQHIPLVNFAYREITGDEIKPISRIIGGGVFGGPAGAASGLVTSVIGEELRGDKAKEERVAYDDLPVALLSFAQTPLPEIKFSSEERNEEISSNRVRFADGRTAGSIAVYS